jgi:hypothetical protein
VRRLLVGVVVLGLAACSGQIENGGNGNGNGNVPPGPGGGGAQPPGMGGGGVQPPGMGGGGVQPPGMGGGGTTDPTAPPPSAQVVCPTAPTGKETIGRRALRRLTNAELETTIRATFGLDAKAWPGLTVPPDSGSLDGFTNHVDKLTVGAEYVRGAAESAAKVASLVTADPMFAQVLPCAATGGPACAGTFLDSVGTKLYRRPLTAPEKTRYLALFDKVGKQGGDFRAAVYWTTVTMLQSPHVIYRSELGEPDGATGRFKLTPYEVASQLAYAFTGGPPGPELLQLAATNRLATPDQLEAAARTLILDGTAVKPAFKQVVLGFAEQWLGLVNLSNLKKDDMAFPDFNSQIQDALGEETRRFMSAVLLEERGSIATLLTAPYTYLDSRLAKFYGYGAAMAKTADYVRVPRPATWGLGLLAQGSMLAVEAHSLTTSPTLRGHLVRTKLLCGVVPPPPPVVTPLPEPTEGNTTRERYEVLHLSDPSCKGCHLLMDPIGFGFEHLDATGRFRAKEGRFDIDDSGVVRETSAGDLTFRGPAELATAVAKLPEVSACVASYVAAHTFGVGHESATCMAATATNELRTGNLSLVDFYVRLARSEHFRLRQQ